MRITKISVEKLFGIFDHEIPLNLDDRITIIHGPNGYGKTIILKMLYGLFNLGFSDFCSIPYKVFKIEFENGDQCEVTTNKKSDDIKEAVIKYLRHGFQPQILRLALQSEKVISATGDENPNDVRDVLLHGKLEVYLVESQRLLRLSKKRKSKNYSIEKLIEKRKQKEDKASSQTEETLALSTVKTYANEIIEHIREIDRKYNTIAQTLDRSFPSRALNPGNVVELTDEVLEEKLKRLEHHQHRLVETGLLVQEQEQDFQRPHHPLDKSTKDFLTVYVEDTEKKLNAFNDLVEKIELFKRIMNSKLSYKEMQIDREQGFIFTIKYPNGHDVGSDTISPTDLSSGEQHELVLLYELLFKVKPKSLVLIDEPELSLHIGWQVNFLQDLQEITKLADIDILIATHAPDLIADRWDLTVELKGVS